MAGPKQLANLRVSALNAASSISALHVHTVNSSGEYVSPGAGSTQVSIREILSSSGGSLIDSSNVSLGVTIRAGAAAGTEYTDGDVDATISGQAILFDNSTNTLRPVTLTRGLPINIVAGQSTIVTVSTGSLRVHQSTAADLNVTVAGYSTIVSVSTGSIRVHQSTASDLNVKIAGNSSAADYTPVRVVDSSGTGFLSPGLEYTNGSTTSTLAAPALTYSNSTNDTMRLVGVTQPLPVQVRTGTLSFLSTTAQITSTHSTALYSLVSSAAATRHKVTAYFVGSTHTNPSTLFFVSSNAQDLWAVNFGSGSSGITGANLAKTAPDFFFGSESAAALQVRVEGGNSTAASTTIVRVSISYFSEA